MRLLIAEDDAVSRRMLELTLKSWGYEVIITENGDDALTVLEDKKAPLLALLDVMMPGINGLEVCRRVRRTVRQVPPFIILLTAMDAKEDVVGGIEAGANDYLTKPFNREELRVRLHAGLKTVELQQLLVDRISELEAAAEQIKRLEGILSICSYCKNIRDHEKKWQQIEGYLAGRASAKLSHGICPDCYDRVIQPQLNSRKKADDC